MYQIRHTYYQIEIPADLSEDPEERARVAILEAQERARIWRVPTIWEVISDNGYTVKVRQTYRIQKGN